MLNVFILIVFLDINWCTFVRSHTGCTALITEGHIIKTFNRPEGTCPTWISSPLFFIIKKKHDIKLPCWIQKKSTWVFEQKTEVEKKMKEFYYNHCRIQAIVIEILCLWIELYKISAKIFCIFSIVLECSFVIKVKSTRHRVLFLSGRAFVIWVNCNAWIFDMTENQLSIDLFVQKSLDSTKHWPVQMNQYLWFHWELVLEICIHRLNIILMDKTCNSL